MSFASHVLLNQHGDAASPRRTSLSSDHSEIPLYPRSEISPPPSVFAATSNAIDTHELHPRASRDPSAAFVNGRHQQQSRPNTASSSVSSSSAGAVSSRRLSFSLARADGARHLKSQKDPAPSRIGRDFEALLASDETYVLRETAKVALDPADTRSSARQGLHPSASTNDNRVIVQRRREGSSSSSLIQALDEADEDETFMNTTPRPPQADLFPSPPPSVQASGSSGTILKSVSGQFRSYGAQIPASPDRTTSLQRHTTNSPGMPSTSSKRQLPVMSTTPGFTLPPGFEVGDGTLRARPRVQNSIGLEEEIYTAPASRSDGANQAASTGTFRQRMKKTSGFLRKFRKDSSSASSSNGSGAAGRTYSIGSNASASSLGRSAATESTLGISSSGRRGSKTSISSQGGSSAAGSSSKAPHFASTEGVAVPSIPERFMQPSTSSFSNLAVASAAPATSVQDAHTAEIPETQHLTVKSKAGLRSPSAPSTMTEWSPSTKFALPQRSSSQGHDNKKSIGSSDSTGAIRLAVQQLSTHMDDAWKQAPAPAIQLADLRNAPAPKRSWADSPQLPGLDIQRYKERSGSFLEEPDIVRSKGRDDTCSELRHTARSPRVFSYSDSAAHADSSADSNNEATGLGIHKGPSAANATIRRAGLASSSLDSTRSSQRNSIDPLADRAPRKTAGSGASIVSVRSFETAAESAGLNSAGPQRNSFGDAVPHKSAVAVAGSRLRHDDTDDSRLSNDQELSIRLVTRPSNTNELSPNSDCHESSTTAIVTAPASPDVGSAALPKMVELSEASFLRPGRNGNLSRTPSMRSGTVKAGSAALLATQAAHRSPSPGPVPPSPVRPSRATAAAPSMDGDASAVDPVAASAQELAAKCWEEDSTFLKREKIAEWLGGLGLVNRAARGYYFANFDFSGLRLDVAFRRLCDKLFLRAETQQIDRILAAFSQRYYECNPESIFGSADVIHSVVFSILLLNTDLHIADLQERMTRQQFVRNTLGAIAESSPDGQLASIQDDNRSSLSVAHNDATRSTDVLPTSISEAHMRNGVVGHLGIRSKQNSSSTHLESSSDAVHSRPATATSSTKDKDAEIETLLRDIYAAVKSERILLPTPETGSGAPGRPSGTFSPTLGGRKKAGVGNDRMTALKRGSIRGIQGLLGGLGPSTSFLDPAVSPNASRTSIDSWGRPSQSLSSGDRERMLSPLPHVTPGFASTLSQTIIKESLEEEGAASANTTLQPPLDDEDDDDQLALAGPPWAKEGSLTRKCYWESTGKRAKDKSWTEVFAVVSKGTLSMFRFNAGPSATRSGAVLGGGNWLSNATCLGEIPLAHSLANALPPPGYNRSRPHVFALTLPGGKVNFFQTGHEELVHEWVSTCNYWAARSSKEPLAGGVSNMEYGWNKVMPQQPEEVEELDGPVESSVGHGRDDRSVRSGRRGTSVAPSIGTSSNAGYSSNERVFINEWRAPTLPTVPSTLSEERQLARLEKQVALIEAELTSHNELRTPMLHLYSPKGANHAKALANWERKSNWLLQELVKYTSYVESLRKSGEGRAERRAKREVDEMVREGDAMLAQLSV